MPLRWRRAPRASVTDSIATRERRHCHELTKDTAFKRKQTPLGRLCITRRAKRRLAKSISTIKDDQRAESSKPLAGRPIQTGAIPQTSGKRHAAMLYTPFPAHSKAFCLPSNAQGKKRARSAVIGRSSGGEYPLLRGSQSVINSAVAETPNSLKTLKQRR